MLCLAVGLKCNRRWTLTTRSEPSGPFRKPSKHRHSFPPPPDDYPFPPSSNTHPPLLHPPQEPLRCSPHLAAIQASKEKPSSSSCNANLAMMISPWLSSRVRPCPSRPPARLWHSRRPLFGSKICVTGRAGRLLLASL